VIFYHQHFIPLLMRSNMQYFGIVGYPIGHSVSPAMHNAAFKHLGLDAIYLKFEVKPEDLRDAIFGAKALGFKGFNVTIPHKEAVLEFDKPVGIAKQIGAVNTIDIPKLEGYNTDAYGALKALESAGVDVEGKIALVVGISKTSIFCRIPPKLLRLFL